MSIAVKRKGWEGSSMGASTVLFTSQRTLERAENIKAVYDAYTGPKRFAQLDIRRIHPALYDSRTRVMVTDEIPAKAPEKCIFIGHGCSCGKYYGLDQRWRYATKQQTNLMTHIVCTSLKDEVIKSTAQMFQVPEDRVYPLGMPRTDQYFWKKKGDGGTFMAGKKAYLYVPTFRTHEELPYFPVDWQAIDDALGDNEVFVVKRHMLDGGRLTKDYKHIVEISRDEPSANYLIDADVVITDYSSIIMDAQLLGKPVVLFAKDADRYLSIRGMYRPYPEGYSGRYAQTEADLMRHIRDALGGITFEEFQCRFQTCNMCDGSATKRVIRLIERVLEE